MTNMELELEGDFLYSPSPSLFLVYFSIPNSKF